MQVQPYLFFDGRCEEAIEFYKKTLGAEVMMLMRFKESPVPSEHVPPGGEKVNEPSSHGVFGSGTPSAPWSS